MFLCTGGNIHLFSSVWPFPCAKVKRKKKKDLVVSPSCDVLLGKQNTGPGCSEKSSHPANCAFGVLLDYHGYN